MRCVFCRKPIQQNVLDFDLTSKFDRCEYCGAYYNVSFKEDVAEVIREITSSILGVSIPDFQINESFELAMTENVNYETWSIREGALGVVTFIKGKEM
jgi:hypothetical protein